MNRRKVLIILSILLAIFFIGGGILAYLNFKPPSAEEISKYEQLIDEGNLFFEGRKFSQAIERYNEAAKVIRSDSRAYSSIVEIYLLKNNPSTASDIAKRAQNYLSSSDSSLIYADIGEKYFEMKDYYNARLNYEIASSLNSNPKVNLGLARSYVMGKEIDLARKLLEKDYDNQTSDNSTLLLAYITALEDSDTAMEIIDSYTIIDTSKVNDFNELSTVLKSLGEDNLYNITKLSRIYINRGYPTLAIILLEPEKDNIDQYVDALYFLGRAYMDVKDYEKATEFLLKSVSVLGYEVEKYWMLGRLYYFMDELPDSMTYYDKAIGYAGDEISKDLIEEYLEVLIDSNQISKAQEVYSRTVINIDEDWLYLIGLELFYSSGNDAKFKYYLGRLSEKELDERLYMEYLFWDIRYSIDNEELEDVEQKLEELSVLDRFNPKYYWLKGLYELKLDNRNQAVEYFETALEYDLDGFVTQEVEKLLARL